MSELNVAPASSSFVTIDKDNTVAEPVQNNAVNNQQIVTDKKEEVEQAPPLTAKEVTETVEEMNSLLQNMQRNLSFTVDEQLGQSVIIVKDSESDEVIRQIPSEELVVLRKKMDDVVGILFETKV
jgi:flagellar protein FlaG